MKRMPQLYKMVFGAGALISAFEFPALASAHEVYVLSQAEIAKDIATPPFSSLQVMVNDLHQFEFWAIVAVTTVIGVFALSIWRRLENTCNPFFNRLKPHAATVSRITIGIAFMASAYYGAAYGPELPLAVAWGAATPFIQLMLTVVGICLLFGIGVRLAALLGLLFFIANSYLHGWYMLTYTNYLGEIILLLIIGAHSTKLSTQDMLSRLSTWLTPYAFLILRVAFGVSLIYASIYAKFIHNNLALDVANSTGLIASVMPHAHTVAEYLHFEPHFLVLGAGIIEIVIGLFFIFGIEIRFTALFIEFWLGLSLWYFGEIVWPHLILIGIPIAFIFYGYDNYSLEAWLIKKKEKLDLEPIL